MTSSRLAPGWRWVFVPTTCSRRCAAVTRAAGSTAMRAGATTSRMSTRHGYLLEVDLSGYLDTGLFLDHRDTRDHGAQDGRGQALPQPVRLHGHRQRSRPAAGGAVETVTVDLSQTYLDWARAQHGAKRFHRACAQLRAWRCDELDHRLTRRSPLPLRFDLRGPAHVQQLEVHGQAHLGCAARPRRAFGRRIAPAHEGRHGGVQRATCASFKPDMEQLGKYGVALEDITAPTIPHDFERNPRIHKCYLVKRA